MLLLEHTRLLNNAIISLNYIKMLRAGVMMNKEQFDHFVGFHIQLVIKFR